MEEPKKITSDQIQERIQFHQDIAHYHLFMCNQLSNEKQILLEQEKTEKEELIEEASS